MTRDFGLNQCVLGNTFQKQRATTIIKGLKVNNRKIITKAPCHGPQPSTLPCWWNVLNGEISEDPNHLSMSACSRTHNDRISVKQHQRL